MVDSVINKRQTTISLFNVVPFVFSTRYPGCALMATVKVARTVDHYITMTTT